MKHPGVRKGIDYRLLGYFIAWLLIGLIFLTSASTAIAHQRFGDSYFFIKRQLTFGVIPGIVFFYIFSKLEYSWLKRFSGLIFLFCLVILFALFIPSVGSSFNGGMRWLVVGGYSIQPSEFIKLGLVIFMAAYLSEKGHDILDWKKGFLPALILGLIPVFLVVVQPDIGTASILFAILFGMLFLAGTRALHIAGLALGGIVAFAGLIVVAPYRAARLTIFLHPELDPLGIGYHINQALLALGSGGIFGLGMGHSRQKFEYLPEVYSDSIFAIMGEELGFIFVTAFILLIVVVAIHGFRLARQVPDTFGRLLISGIIIWFVAQSFLNIGAMAGLVPLTGVPLPFVSHGGSALAVLMGAVGLIMNVSRQRG